MVIDNHGITHKSYTIWYLRINNIYYLCGYWVITIDIKFFIIYGIIHVYGNVITKVKPLSWL